MQKLTESYHNKKLRRWWDSVTCTDYCCQSAYSTFPYPVVSLSRTQDHRILRYGSAVACRQTLTYSVHFLLHCVITIHQCYRQIKH